MEPVLVSVVIPTFNYGHFVTEAVDSALAQTYPHREVIVVDDGSTDGTREMLERYGDRIRYLHQNNQGLSATRNTGIRAARGEYVGLLDADDLWHPRKLEFQVAYLNEHPEVSLLASDRILDRRECWPAVESAPDTVAVTCTLEDVLCRTCFAPSSALIRKNCLESAGLFDPALRCVEDRDLWIRLAATGALVRLPLPLIWYRWHPTSLSSKAGPMEEAELRVLHKAFTQVPALRGRWLFRRKVYSLSALLSGQQFAAAHQWGAATRRVLRSLLLWPLPYRRDEADVSFIRIRVLATLWLRMLGLRAPDPRNTAGAAAAPILQGRAERRPEAVDRKTSVGA